MKKFDNPLDHVSVAAPCPTNWDEMFAFKNDNVRFCDQCKKNVYNLSGMTQKEAINLITQTEDQLCVRFYRRSDGTILTQNCPVGLRAIKQKAQWVSQVLFGATMSLLTLIGSHWLIKIMEDRNLINREVMGARVMTGDIARPRVEPTPDPAKMAIAGQMSVSNKVELGDIPKLPNKNLKPKKTRHQQ